MGSLQVETMVADVRFALRLMRANRAFTAIAVLTLALGIGANTAVFSLVDAVMLHPLPYPEPDRLEMLWTVEGKSQRGHHSSYPDFEEWRRQSRTFEGMAAFHGASFNVTGATGGADHVTAVAGTPGLLEVLGVRPALGRSFSPADGLRSAVISNGLWLKRYGGERAVVGKSIRLDGEDYLIVGVLPRAFHFQPRLDSEPDALVPVEPVPSRTSWFLRVVGRLRPGATLAQARAEMDAIARRIVQADPELDARQGVRVDPMIDTVVQGAGRTSLLLIGAVVVLLLIACANVGSLLLARGTGRESELAIRAALGATRPRLVRQLLTEALLIAFAGASVGLGLACLSLPLLARMAPVWTPFFSRVQDNGVQLNAEVLGFTAALSVAAALVFGIVPALRCTRPVRSTVAAGTSGASSGLLIAIEVALSFVLLAGAALMVSSLHRLLNVDPGFSTDGLLSLSVSLPEKAYATDASRNRYAEAVVERLADTPGVQSVAAVAALPLTGEYSTNGFAFDDGARAPGRAEFQSVTPSYFRTLSIPVVRGRAIDATDSADARPVAMVNRAFEARFFPGQDAVGHILVVPRITAQHAADGMHLVNEQKRVEIVGVAGDTRQLGLDYAAWPEILMPLSQRPPGDLTFVVRAAEGFAPSALARQASARVQGVDPDLPATDIRTMEEWIARGTAPSRFVLALLAIFAVVAVTLAGAGIYGVVAHSVSRRRREMAVRIVLGARVTATIGWVTLQHFRWVLAGLTAGVGAALGAARLLSKYLYGIQPTDAATFAVTAAILLAVALAADLIPASRVATIEPARVLKSE